MGLAEATPERLAEVAQRSEGHARAVTLVTMMQQGIERQRRIWVLRAEIVKHRTLLAEAQAALEVEEAEMQLDRDLASVFRDQLVDALPPAIDE